MKINHKSSVILSNVIFSIYLLLLFSDCRVLRSVSDPAVRLYKRGSCISIDIPPITLTPSQTSLERQLIGDDAAIEENGWLIASAKNAGGSVSKDEGITETRDLYRDIGVMEYFAEDMQKYKQIGFIGESHDGNLYILPNKYLTHQGSSLEADEIRRATFIIGEINLSRKNILQYHLKRKSAKGETDINTLHNKYKYNYYNQVKSGEWRQLKEGTWEKIK